MWRRRFKMPFQPCCRTSICLLIKTFLTCSCFATSVASLQRLIFPQKTGALYWRDTTICVFELVLSNVKLSLIACSYVFIIVVSVGKRNTCSRAYWNFAIATIYRLRRIVKKTSFFRARMERLFFYIRDCGTLPRSRTANIGIKRNVPICRSCIDLPLTVTLRGGQFDMIG